MKTKLLIIAGLAIIALAAVFWAKQSPALVLNSSPSVDNASQKLQPQQHVNSSQPSAMRVPAFYESPPSTLPPTLSPDKFTGKTRAAYKAVKEIPQTVAQLPCYCYCDEAHGHKSLHSCFENDHAGGCAVCVEEVLLAYRLEKKEKLKPAQIRDRIVAQYSAGM